MKKIVALLLVASLALGGGIPLDKQKHMIAGTVIYVGCMAAGQILDDDRLNRTTCLIPVAIAGIGKELYDRGSRSGTPEVMDAVATVAVPVVLNFTLARW